MLTGFLSLRVCHTRHTDKERSQIIMATATEPIRSKDELQAMAEYFREKGEFRNCALIIVGACTALRISDLLSLKWSDVYDENRRKFRAHVTLTEQKTGKRKAIALNENAIYALRCYYPHRKSMYIFASQKGDRPIDRSQAWRIVHEAANAVGATGHISCHSLRKTWGYHAWRSGKVSPVVIMDIYNHSSYSITKRYLGVQQDDLDAAYLGMDLF